jgi:predicted nucleotidyltransferase
MIPNMGKSNPPTAPVPVRTSIANALFSKVQQRVLAVLFGNPTRSFFASEVIRSAASGSGAVQRELARLESAGLVTVQRLGRQKHYRANAAAPVFDELRSLVLKTSGLADQLRAALAPRAANIRAAFVFGSVAKQEDTASSDIDLMVISDELAYGEVFEMLEPVSAKLGRIVNPTVYSTAELASRRAKSNAFTTRVLQQPKLWVIGSDDDIAA